MEIKNFLYKLFLFIFFLFFHNSFSWAFSFENRNDYNFCLNKKHIKKFLFLKKNTFFCFFEKNRFKIFYIVKEKDTLYSISKNSCYNYHELSKLNSIEKPYKIFIGQKIFIGDFLINKKNNNFFIRNLGENTIRQYNPCKLNIKKSLDISHFLKNNVKLKKICFFCNFTIKKNNNFINRKSFNFYHQWNWPVKIKNIKYFYISKLNHKNIEISGFKEQEIFSVAAGEVVCITNEFKKYGRLIIIRHDKNYLSIYGFNSLIFVKKKDKVYAKQKISTMGYSSENNLVRLYFEIRYQGKCVNPLNILPKINLNM